MNNLGSLSGPAWALPAVALAVAAAALALGRRLLRRAPAARASAGPDLDEALCGVNRERRKIPRRKGGCAEAELADGAGGPPLYAWVLDHSAGGLCLLLDRPLAAGAALHGSGSPQRGRTLSAAVVRSCRQARGGWEAHVQFARTPSWNVLALFG